MGTLRLQSQMEETCDQQAIKELQEQHIMNVDDLLSQHHHVIKISSVLAKFVSRPNIMLVPVPASKDHMYAVIPKNNSTEDPMQNFDAAISNTKRLLPKFV